MKLRMRMAAILAVPLWISCGKGGELPPVEVPTMPERGTVISGAEFPRAGLEELAELERAGSYVQGLALRESGLREEAGDYGGAVLAAYKELAWLYGLGGALLSDLEAGVRRVMDRYGGEGEGGNPGDAGAEEALRAARGVLAFLGGRWEEAGELLAPFAGGEAPDSFSRWMLLVCALEGGDTRSEVRGAYASIRGRYGAFPEYWYRGARAFPDPLSPEYAERCVNLSPRGPFAAECRGIIARALGLAPPEGEALLSRAEIEDLISRSASSGEPEILEGLFPLISLPDNPYTLYALGALRALAPVPRFRDFFAAEGARSSGRLAERLAYASRG